MNDYLNSENSENETKVHLVVVSQSLLPRYTLNFLCYKIALNTSDTLAMDRESQTYYSHFVENISSGIFDFEMPKFDF